MDENSKNQQKNVVDKLLEPTEEEEEYCPEEDDDGQDDETTLEEVEKFENQGEVADELAALQQEQDLSIADLLKLYGCDPSSEQPDTQASSANTFNSSDANNSSLEKSEEFWGQSSLSDARTSPECNDLNLLTGSPGKLDVFDENDDDYEPEQSDSWHKLIQVGSEYQAEILDQFPDHTDRVDNSQLIFDPGRLDECSVIDYLIKFHSLVGKSEAPIPDQPRLPDDEIGLLHLHNNNYDTQVALNSTNLDTYANQLQSDVPTYGWSPAELGDFEQGLKKFGKNFHAIKQNLGQKTVKDVVKLYYYWKFSPMYTRFTAALDQEYTDYLQTMARIRQVEGTSAAAPRPTTFTVPQYFNDRPTYDHASLVEIGQSAADANERSSATGPPTSERSTGDQWPLSAAALAPPPVPPRYRVVCRNGRLKIRWLTYHHIPPHSIEESDTHRRQFIMASSANDSDWSAQKSDWSTNGGGAFLVEQRPPVVGDELSAECSKTCGQGEYCAGFDFLSDT